MCRVENAISGCLLKLAVDRSQVDHWTNVSNVVYIGLALRQSICRVGAVTQTTHIYVPNHSICRVDVLHQMATNTHGRLVLIYFIAYTIVEDLLRWNIKRFTCLCCLENRFHHTKCKVLAQLVQHVTPDFNNTCICEGYAQKGSNQQPAKFHHAYWCLPPKHFAVVLSPFLIRPYISRALCGMHLTNVVFPAPKCIPVCGRQLFLPSTYTRQGSSHKEPAPE
jgi:hypothetical protein